MKKIVIFGAGNIGRSFIGQLFSSAGYFVTFIDTDRKLVGALQEKKSYHLVVKKDETPDKTMTIGPVGAVDGHDSEAVLRALTETDYAATAVGLRALPHIIPLISRAALVRSEEGRSPLDIILAENIHDGRAFFLKEARKSLPDQAEPSSLMGIVECSIGKMVPIMAEEDLKEDPLQLFAEEYNSLILDGKGFLTACPSVEGILPVSDIQAYVDRKLYLHNLGHAAAAWFGFREEPESRLIADVMKNPGVKERVRSVMEEASRLLLKLHPREFTPEDLDDHAEDLIARFSNRALGDTVYRVGRDLGRKLDKSDRVLGAALQAVRQGTGCSAMIDVFRAGLQFRGDDGSGRLFPPDEEFLGRIKGKSLSLIGREVCRLDAKDPAEAGVLEIFREIEERK